jgi:hypothetical protein
LEDAAVASTEDRDVRWAASALVLTSIVAIIAKICGVIVAPGARGLAGEDAINFLDTASGAFSYILAALLIALVSSASFELARTRGVHVTARIVAVLFSGLILALCTPAVVGRLSTVPLLALAVVTGVVALVSGVFALRAPATRLLGAVLSLLAVCGLLRVVAWETAAVAFERLSKPVLDVSRAFSTFAVVLQALATLLIAAWLGTRSKLRGRILANGAIVLAFLFTWLANRNGDSPSTIEAILRSSLMSAAGVPSPFLVGSIAEFLVPASILLAAAMVAERSQPRAIVTALALALLSNGAFDVPLQALLVTTAAQWAMLAQTEDRSSWIASALVRPRS